MEAQAKEKPSSFSDERKIILFATLFLFGLFYRYWILFPKVTLPYGATVGDVESASGLKQRHSDQLSWTNVRRKANVFAGDWLYTPEDASATLRLDSGEDITLEPNTVILVDQIDKDHTTIKLVSGKASSSARSVTIEPIYRPLSTLQHAPKIREVAQITPPTPTPPPAPIEVPEEALPAMPAPDDFLKRAASLPKKYALANSSYHLEKLKEVPPEIPIQFDDLGDFEIQAFAKKDPNSKEQWTQFMWSVIPLKDVNYEVEVSRNVHFRKPIIYDANENKVAVQLIHGGKLYWRVRAKRHNVSLLSSPLMLQLTQ